MAKQKFITKIEQTQKRNELKKQIANWEMQRKKSLKGSGLQDLPYVMIGKEILYSTYLTDAEIRIYELLKSCTDNNTSETFVGDERLAGLSRKGVSSVQRILHSLEQKKMIQRLTVSTDDRIIVLLPYPLELYLQIEFAEKETGFDKYVRKQIEVLGGAETELQIEPEVEMSDITIEKLDSEEEVGSATPEEKMQMEEDADDWRNNPFNADYNNFKTSVDFIDNCNENPFDGRGCL